MITKEKVENLSLQALEGTELYIVDISVGSGAQIEIILDSDTGVKIEECKKVSRFVERELDPEQNEFSLMVASPGLDEPFVLKRQYKKNVGRKVQVLKVDGEKIEGTLVVADEEKIQLEWKAREPKEVGKGKRTVVKTEEIGYENIKEAKVVITF